VLTPANKESASSSHVLRHFFVDCLAGKVVQFVNVISSTRSSGGDAVLLGSCSSLDRTNANHSAVLGALIAIYEVCTDH
jgi:hypothetical protein